MEAPSWEAAPYRMTFSYSNLDLSANSSPVPLANFQPPLCRGLTLFWENTSTLHPRYNFFVLRWRGGGILRTATVNPVSDCMNTLPISKLGIEPLNSDTWFPQPQRKQLILQVTVLAHIRFTSAWYITYPFPAECPH